MANQAQNWAFYQYVWKDVIIYKDIVTLEKNTYYIISGHVKMSLLCVR